MHKLCSNSSTLDELIEARVARLINQLRAQCPHIVMLFRYWWNRRAIIRSGPRSGSGGAMGARGRSGRRRGAREAPVRVRRATTSPSAAPAAPPAVTAAPAPGNDFTVTSYTSLYLQFGSSLFTPCIAVMWQSIVTLCKALATKSLKW